jgi:hypothetical protein
MGKAAGYKATGSLPKTLAIMKENELRSWQIYTDIHGISCRIRFGSGCHASSQPEHNSAYVNKQTGNLQHSHIAYTKKTKELKVKLILKMNGHLNIDIHLLSTVILLYMSVVFLLLKIL